MKQYLITMIVGFTLIVSVNGCAVHAPVALSPEAQKAWHGTRVIKAFDVLRDAAIDANAQTPPLISEGVTRQIVQIHQASLEIIPRAPSGWPATVMTALDELEHRLLVKDRNIVHPYIELIKTLLKEIPK